LFVVRRFHNPVRSILILAGVVCAALPDRAQSCNVPVFRYAMERWQADAYRIVVRHRAGNPGAGYDLLRQSLARKGGRANFYLEAVGVTAGQPDFGALPLAEVHYPEQTRIVKPVWTGGLTEESARRILDSPARSNIAERLLAGDIAVWVLVRSGRQEKDRPARESLRASLERASATLRIPDTGPDANGDPVEVTDFKSYPVHFGMIEIARDDPREELLVNALLKSEPDLEAYDEPLAFPVFGRGRALFGLAGAGIQEKNIREACESMLAWCSCEIKAQNPGTDLPIAADWSKPFGGTMVRDPEVPLTGIGAFLKQPAPQAPAASVPSAPSGAPALCKLDRPKRGGEADGAPPPPGRSPVTRNLVYLAVGGGAALAALSVYLTVRARQ
jgi:hypothetical protein